MATAADLSYKFDTSGIDSLSNGAGGSDSSTLIKQSPSIAPALNQGMNSGSSAGGVLTGAGVYGMMAGAAAGPAALGAGLALSAYEQSKKAEAMNEQARVQEAQQRKSAVQNALNEALGATRQLGV